MKRILGVFNSISETTIPVENFVILDDKKFYKKIITFNSTFLDAHKCINQKGDFGKIEILSLFHYKIKLLNPLFAKSHLSAMLMKLMSCPLMA